MPCGAGAVPGRSIIKAVFDTSVLVSAFLSRNNPEEFQVNSSVLLSKV